MTEYVTTKEIAELTGARPRTVRRRHESGELPAFRNPNDRRQLLYRRADAERVFQINART